MELQKNKTDPKLTAKKVTDIKTAEGDGDLKVKRRALFVLVALGIIAVILAFRYGKLQREVTVNEKEGQTAESQEGTSTEVPIPQIQESTSTASAPESATTTAPEESVPAPTVRVTETPTGWLNVRSGPGTGYRKVALVYPDESYPLLEESKSWYKIKLKDGKEGWIYTAYAEKQ